MANKTNFLSRIPKRNLVFFIMLAVTLAALFFVMVHVPQTARGNLESMLKNAGFADAKVRNISLRPSGLIARNIELDSFGFDKIGTLRADFSWPSFLASGKISQLTVKDISISRTDDTLPSTARQLVAELLNLPAYRISITNAVIDISTGFGDLRLNADAAINTDNKPQDRDIHASIKSAQYQLGFDSSWEGTLDKNGRLELSAKIDGGRLNMGPLRVSRFNGWAGLDIEGSNFSFQSQMEAGGASLFQIPLHNVTLVNDHHADQASMMFRAGIAGMGDTILTADYSRQTEDQSFTALLHGPSLSDLLDFARQSGKPQKTLREPLARAGEFTATLSYQPDRRFVGGPLPFAVSLAAGDEKPAAGNMLFYPDTFDVRGSVETDTAMASALQSYFKIPSENLSRNFIRLDGNARRFFEGSGSEDKPAAAP